MCFKITGEGEREGRRREGGGGGRRREDRLGWGGK
jgi:hypothetical protein